MATHFNTLVLALEAVSEGLKIPFPKLICYTFSSVRTLN